MVLQDRLRVARHKQDKDNGGIHHVYHIRPAYQRWQPEGGARFHHGGGSLIKAEIIHLGKSENYGSLTVTAKQDVRLFDIVIVSLAGQVYGGSGQTLFFYISDDDSGSFNVDLDYGYVELSWSGKEITLKDRTSSNYYFYSVIGLTL
jgi:hypothetical protein